VRIAPLSSLSVSVPEEVEKMLAPWFGVRI
jgi:hypothetical protein